MSSSLPPPRQQSHPLTHSSSDRCWICLEEVGKNKREWYYPCNCSLICHEECLLHWVSESEQRTRAGVVRCPQCNTPYTVVQWTSKTFAALSTIHDAADRAMPLFVAAIGGMAVVVSCAAYGAYAVMTVYGETVGKRLLNAPEKLGAMRWAMLSSIPLTLILSRFQASMMYLPVTALLLAPRPLLMQWPMSPSLTLMALPAISTLYRRFWRMTLGRLEHRWESHVPPEQSIFTIQGFEMHADTPARGELLVLDQVANENEQQGFARADRNFEALIMLNGVSLRRTVVESLLLPAISSLCGTLIAKLPFVRSGLSQFSKAVLGGCAYFVVKDLVRIFYKYLLFRSRSSRYIKGRKRL